jgi:hypothetical protein
VTTDIAASPNIHQLPAADVIDLTGLTEAERDAREIQAISEGVVEGDTVECMGKHYRVADRIGLMPLMKFAHSAAQGLDGDDMEGLNAIYEMLRDCIHEDDWARFMREMTQLKAEADDMMPVITRTIEIINARPTRQRSASSNGPSSTSPTSTGGSSLRVPDGVEDLVPVGQLGSSR